MKRLYSASMLGVAMFVLSTNASAVVINSVDVGALDTFIGSADLANSGLATEAGFISSSSLGLTLTKDDVMQFQVKAGSPEVCQGTLCYFDLGAGSSHSFFLLKFGADPNYADHYLFANVADTRYAVYDRSLNGMAATNCGPQQKNKCVNGLSHVTVAKSSVPEPGSMALLGAGLLGMGLIRRRRAACYQRSTFCAAGLAR